MLVETWDKGWLTELRQIQNPDISIYLFVYSLYVSCIYYLTIEKYSILKA